ncbi:MAG: hypothetical protein M1828_003911 [Chrysothrix sp. TS-e1954]|nr:MAG: hypothetical protein M1828_003911 [Chrysothrix sp. TS-e1954]
MAVSLRNARSGRPAIQSPFHDSSSRTLTPTQQSTRQFNNNNNGYLPNGAPPSSGPVPGAAPLLPNQGRIVQQGSTRILCIADVRGNLRSLNDLARTARADYIIHTGDFGFYDERSLDRVAEKTLKHVAQYSPLISDEARRQVATAPPNLPIKEHIPRHQLPLSQLPEFLRGTYQFDVPVYTVWGACEDVQVLEKLRSGEYKVDKLHIIDESHSRLLDIGGVKLRLLGLGGALVMHKLFDNGEGRTTIAGGQGTMWTTLLQMGELIDTANRVYDPSETRLLVTHASPAREGLLHQLSVNLKVDFSISAGLHFRYGSSYNEFSVNPSLDHYRGKLAASKASFNDVWETVKSEVEPAVAENEAQQRLLHNAIDIVSRMPSVANGGNPFGGQIGSTAGQIDESAFKNMWNFNLADAAFGYLVLEVDQGRIATEMRAQGFNFSHRGARSLGVQSEMAKVSGQSPGMIQNASPSVNAQVPNAQLPQGQPRVPMGPSASAAPQAAVQQRPNQQARAPTGPQNMPIRSNQPGPTAPAQSSQQAPQPKAATPAAAPSPAPQAQTPASQTAKQSTSQAPPPAAAAAANGSSTKPTPSEVKTNGAGAEESDTAKRVPTPNVEKKPSQAIFMQNISSTDEGRSLIPEEHRSKIQRMERVKSSCVAHFNSAEEMQTVLRAAQTEMKKNGTKTQLKPYEDRGPSSGRKFDSWGSNPRGGAQQGGYRSGGASDSEGGRGGRGSFRGRPRGGDRGRGGRAGRGGFSNRGGPGEGTSSPAPAAAGGSS